MARKNNDYNDRYKKSACKLTVKDGKPTLSGWNASKTRGLISFVATPRNAVGKRKTKSKRFENWAVKVTVPSLPQPMWLNGLYDLQKKRLLMPDLYGGMLANPSTPVGETRSGKKVSGYFGKMYRS